MIILILIISYAYSTKTSYAENDDTLDIASIYISIAEDITRDEYKNAIIEIVDQSGGIYETITDNNASIKIRGNSTSELSKKPYNFKLDKKTNVLGVGKSKKWCLLANYLDPTLLRNKIALDFAQRAGVEVYCKSTFVDVYINGELQGNYLLTVPVDKSIDCLDEDVEEWDYLLEVERSRQEEGATYINTGMVRLLFNEPEEPTEEQQNEVIEYLKK